MSELTRTGVAGEDSLKEILWSLARNYAAIKVGDPYGRNGGYVLVKGSTLQLKAKQWQHRWLEHDCIEPYIDGGWIIRLRWGRIEDLRDVKSFTSVEKLMREWSKYKHLQVLKS